MKRTAINFFAAAVLVFGATAAFAGTATSPSNSGNITATVASNCTIGTFNLAFGSYDPTSTTATTTSTTLDVRCTKGTSASVVLSEGSNTSRKMQSGTTSDYLDYEIYSDSSYSAIWPSSGTSYGLSFTGGVVQTLTVYGKIPAHEAAAAGSDYADTVVATVNW